MIVAGSIEMSAIFAEYQVVCRNKVGFFLVFPQFFYSKGIDVHFVTIVELLSSYYLFAGGISNPSKKVNLIINGSLVRRRVISVR